jgi:type IV pilus assembly protein PilB
MRLLDKDNIKVGIRQLGLAERDFKIFTQTIKRPNGIMLVTGPTGSGKTTTLYAALNAMNRPDKKIITAEDPVEYYLPGINQVEVRHNIGLDFARIIRSMLRQAPNIILVGEMRDTETASMGIQASLTGHLVFSTLHTNDAPSAVTRMTDMGVPGYLVASSVVAVLGQRLVRTICKRCKTQVKMSESQLAEAGIPAEVAEKATFVKGKGCGYCQKSGYRGRMGIYELMVVSSKIREMMFAGKSTIQITEQAIKEGMTTLYCDGIRKAMKGLTTIEEVYRVAKHTEQDELALKIVFDELLSKEPS